MIHFLLDLELEPFDLPDDLNLEVGRKLPLNLDLLFTRRRENLLPLITPGYARRQIAH